MNDRAEILFILKEVRKLVATCAAYLPFNEKMSQYLDWLDQRIVLMENRE